ncbi:MAG: hypothetical protein OEW48_01890 [Phycisphaerae bacterium]|nr:hypothetical protein [Phycisphaerae bacterium]
MITRRKVVISLAVNFSLQWALALLCWMGCFHARAMVIWMAPTAPPYYGFRFLAKRDLDMALVSLIITALTIGLCLLAIRLRRTLTLVAAHIALVIYWLWSFCLLGIGV